MALSPYDVLAPYASLNPAQRLDRWAQLRTAPPPLRAVEPQESPAAPSVSPAPDAPIEDTAAPPSDASPASHAAPPMPPRAHRLYDQILKKHTAAAQSVFTSAMRRP